MAADTQRLYDESRAAVARNGDRVFLGLLLAQWAVAVLLALFLPASSHDTYFHVELAFGAGGLINILPLALIRFRPGWWATRHVVAGVQMLWSGIFITITGGRIETHFHIFASLAALTVYRDWKLLITATAVVAVDQLVRGSLWPESVYGIANPEWWRVIEHLTWVAFEDIVLVISCVRQTRDLRTDASRRVVMLRTNERVERQVQERTVQLQDGVDRYRALVENTSAIPFEWDRRARAFVYIAPQAAERLGLEPEDLAGDWLLTDGVHVDDQARLADAIRSTLEAKSNRMTEIDYRLVTHANELLHLRVLISGHGGERHLRGIILDMTTQRQLELELRQAQKLESVGRLAAGVAHEINTPVQYVGDSLQFVRDSIGDLFEVLERHRASTARVLADRPDDAVALAALAADEGADLPYLVEEYPKSLDRALDGLHRVATIVRSMKVFAHPDQGRTSVDLNAAIASMLTIASSEYKYIADVELHLGDVPQISCFAGEVNQVLLNLVVNAAHAIEEIHAASGKRGTIAITTAVDRGDVIVSIADTGCGIPETIRDRVFDPFFTTKVVGKGTGQGLAIARRVIVELHGGALTFATTVGEGTTFRMRLPVTAPAPREKST